MAHQAGRAILALAATQAHQAPAAIRVLPASVVTLEFPATAASLVTADCLDTRVYPDIRALLVRAVFLGLQGTRALRDSQVTLAPRDTPACLVFRATAAFLATAACLATLAFLATQEVAFLATLEYLGIRASAASLDNLATLALAVSLETLESADSLASAVIVAPVSRAIQVPVSRATLDSVVHPVILACRGTRVFLVSRE